MQCTPPLFIFNIPMERKSDFSARFNFPPCLVSNEVGDRFVSYFSLFPLLETGRIHFPFFFFPIGLADLQSLSSFSSFLAQRSEWAGSVFRAFRFFSPFALHVSGR